MEGRNEFGISPHRFARSGGSSPSPSRKRASTSVESPHMLSSPESPKRRRLTFPPVSPSAEIIPAQLPESPENQQLSETMGERLREYSRQFRAIWSSSFPGERFPTESEIQIGEASERQIGVELHELQIDDQAVNQIGETSDLQIGSELEIDEESMDEEHTVEEQIGEEEIEEHTGETNELQIGAELEIDEESMDEEHTVEEQIGEEEIEEHTGETNELEIGAELEIDEEHMNREHIVEEQIDEEEIGEEQTDRAMDQAEVTVRIDTEGENMLIHLTCCCTKDHKIVICGNECYLRV